MESARHAISLDSMYDIPESPDDVVAYGSENENSVIERNKRFTGILAVQICDDRKLRGGQFNHCNVSLISTFVCTCMLTLQVTTVIMHPNILRFQQRIKTDSHKWSVYLENGTVVSQRAWIKLITSQTDYCSYYRLRRIILYGCLWGQRVLQNIYWSRSDELESSLSILRGRSFGKWILPGPSSLFSDTRILGFDTATICRLQGLAALLWATMRR